MKRILIAALALLAGSFAAFGQDSFRKTFSLEIGAGMGPMHMYLNNPSSRTEKILADMGQEAVNGVFPAFSLSGALRTWDRWETVVTVGVSWGHQQIIQYEPFGLDPLGKTRYDLQKKSPAGWKDLDRTWSLTLQERVFWNPRWLIQMYTGWGLGVVQGERKPYVLPSFTPVALRVGGRHFYGFLEMPFSPYGLLYHGGLGLKF